MSEKEFIPFSGGKDREFHAKFIGFEV